MNVLYALAMIIACAELVILMVRGGKNQSIYQLLIYVMIAICNTGYFLMAISKTADAAVMCNNFTYIGAVFLPFFIVLTIAQLCSVKIPKSVIILIPICSFVVLALVCSVGYSDIYYKNVTIDKAYNVTYMIKEYGPAHNAYHILLFSEVAICIGIIIKAIRKKANFTKRTVVGVLLILVVPCIVYIVERAVGSRIEFIPFMYVIVSGIYLEIELRMKMYDMSSSVVRAFERLDEYGYITFDLKRNLMNCNDMAKNIFSELNQMEIDAAAKKEDSVFYNEIISWLEEGSNNGTEKKLKVGSRSIKCTVRKIRIGVRKRTIGYCVELLDITKEEAYINYMRDYNVNLEKEVLEKTEHIRAMQESIITGMASVVESRDNSTGGHIRRTSEGVKILVSRLEEDDVYNVSKSFYKNVIKSAPMHDLGKIGVDDKILRKTGRFTDEEYSEMKKHSEIGAKIVAEVLAEVKDEEFVAIAKNVAYYHHEKWDGSGYPRGLKGEEIPLEARIMALADVFDALVSKRCYKEAYNYDKAFNIIEESLGSHFDPELGAVFISLRDKLEKLYDNLAE